MKMRNRLIRGGLIVLLIIAATGCGSRSLENMETEIPTDAVPDQETWNFDFLLSSSGIMQAKVKSGHMVKFNRKGVYELNQSVVVDFFDKGGNHASTLFSDSGVVDEKNTFMTVSGNVKAVSDDGMILLTEELKWSKEKKKIFTDKFVTIYSKGDTVRGYGFESGQELKRWKIFKPVGSTDRNIVF
ncbi:LPS export ABC transporter periplasmic protein LptC [candidate division KSB1 bacterium]